MFSTQLIFKANISRNCLHLFKKCPVFRFQSLYYVSHTVAQVSAVQYLYWQLYTIITCEALKTGLFSEDVYSLFVNGTRCFISDEPTLDFRIENGSEGPQKSKIDFRFLLKFI